MSRRMPDRETVQQEGKAWAGRRNQTQMGGNWQFTTKDARIKLRRLYSQIQC